MRLLNIHTLELREFFGVKIPSYAILSHRWGEDEVSYQIFSKRHKEKHQDYLRNSTGYQKILDFCKHIDEHKNDYPSLDPYHPQPTPGPAVEWVWIDTCCIDKSSSAELTEAINSMFSWYQNARICVVYLADASDLEDFDESDWFNRGWTLQELLAPPQVTFVNHVWEPLGNRRVLSDQISKITNIDRFTLLHGLGNSTPISEKFSWAAKRNTQRVEDMAYSLLGLFGVNMSLLYGEGTRAFDRLQAEIIKTSTDESIFAWTSVSDEDDGFFARHPSKFYSGQSLQIWLPELTPWTALFRELKQSPYELTNLGLRLDGRFISKSAFMGVEFGIIMLRCFAQRLYQPFMLVLREYDGNIWEIYYRDQTQIRERLCPKLMASYKRGAVTVAMKTIIITKCAFGCCDLPSGLSFDLLQTLTDRSA